MADQLKELSTIWAIVTFEYLYAQGFSTIYDDVQVQFMWMPKVSY